MDTAKLVMSGDCQAVKLPKDYQFEGSDVYIKKLGKMVVLFSKDDPWSILEDSLDQFSDDFMNERNQPLS